LIDNGRHVQGLKFWFEAGTKDEESDRNNNGIIDSIDDTLDLISALKRKGYTDSDILYLEIEGGEHNFNTWSEAFPKFISWVLA
ncbi:MAG TPA: esterase family protein, partial [Roseivirga sp.]